ncbi:hypothetical protein L596_017453 [Steinernema carpocapsae]|uniref:Uncharacterized protein n=1 Tax=Steinernema carpocapsae TaxID=34508 RepID=A0A4U5N236_STECR|nr:hypothetical protein L596_017453 [Steinernema carpocapsae]
MDFVPIEFFDDVLQPPCEKLSCELHISNAPDPLKTCAQKLDDLGSARYTNIVDGKIVIHINYVAVNDVSNIDETLQKQLDRLVQSSGILCLTWNHLNAIAVYGVCDKHILKLLRNLKHKKQLLYLFFDQVKKSKKLVDLICAVLLQKQFLRLSFFNYSEHVKNRIKNIWIQNKEQLAGKT